MSAKKPFEQKLSALESLSATDLDSLEAEVLAAYEAADAEDNTDEMTELVNALEAIQTRRDALTSEDESASPEEPAEEPAEEAPAEEPAEETPAEEPAVEEPAAEDAPTEETPVIEAVTAEVIEIVPNTEEESLAMAASATFEPPESARPVLASASVSIRAGADIPGYSAGSEFASIADVNQAFLQRLNATKRSGGRGGDGEQHSVLTLTASIPEDRMLAPGDIEGNSNKIEAVTGESAIVASGGYCAPLQVKYDIFGLGSAARPVRDGLPTFGATRGGIRFVTPPKLGDYTNAVALWSAGEDVIAGSQQVITNKALTSNVATITTSAPHGYVVGQTVTVTGVGVPFDGTYTITAVTSTTFSYARTNADVTSAAATGSTQLVKPCLKVNCAAELTASTDAVTLCLAFGNLMTRAYPELVQRHNALALVQQARFAEQNLLNQISAASTAVTSAFKIGTGRDLLLAIGKASAAYRNRHRLPRTTNLRVIMPEWVLDAIREDLAQSLPGDQLLAAGDAIINSYLAARNVNVTWHMDDTFAAQGAGAIVDFPATVKWYIFAEGTFLFLDGGTLDLGIIRDSSLVGTNDYKTFVETFEGLAKVGIESIQVTSTTHVSGGTVGTVVVS